MRIVCTINKGWYNISKQRYLTTTRKGGMLLGGRVLVLGKLTLVLDWTREISQGKWSMTQCIFRATIDVCEMDLSEEGWNGEEEGDFMRIKVIWCFFSWFCQLLRCYKAS